jgi:hypothetical protein
MPVQLSDHRSEHDKQSPDLGSLVAVSTLLSSSSPLRSPTKKITPRILFPPRNLVDEQVSVPEEETTDTDDELTWGVVPQRTMSLSESDEDAAAAATTTTTTEGAALPLPPPPPLGLSFSSSYEQECHEQTQKQLEKAAGFWNRNILSYVQDLPLATLLKVSKITADAVSSAASSSSSVSSASSPRLSDTTSDSSSNHVVVAKKKNNTKQTAAKTPFARNKSHLQPTKSISSSSNVKKKNSKKPSVPTELRLAKLWKSHPDIPREVEVRTKPPPPPPTLEPTKSHQSLITAATATTITSGSTTVSGNHNKNNPHHPNLSSLYSDDDDDDQAEVNVTLTFRSRKHQRDESKIPPLTQDNVVSLATYLSKLPRNAAASSKKATTATTATSAIETSYSNLTKATATTSSSTASSSSIITATKKLSSSSSNHNNDKSWLQQWRVSARYAWDNKDWLRVMNLPKTIVVTNNNNNNDSPTTKQVIPC